MCIRDRYYSAEDSLNAIRDLLRKKRYDPKSATDQEMRKIYGYLARKGFGYEEMCIRDRGRPLRQNGIIPVH